MSYSEIMNRSIGNVYQAGIATKILQHMGRIRNSSDRNQARRWVMELLQNAQDVSWSDRGVRVRIEIKQDSLEFSHTGKPFRIQDILSIVNQVSSKVDDENTVGQFGTGFVTTFQLSEQVKLKGVLKEDGEPYRPFEVLIDRRGVTKDEVLAGIKQAMDVLYKVDDSGEILNYKKDEFYTVFSYALNSEHTRELARIGMEDLRETICYVLLFTEKIKSVELVYSIPGEERKVSYSLDHSEGLGEKLRLAEFVCTDGNTVQKEYVCYSTKDGMTLAANYSPDKEFLPLSGKCSRLFIDFPLIGAEQFPFPMVINDRRMEPNEPRSGISLVDNENSQDARNNKELILKAVEQYREFLEEALHLELNGLSNILKIPAFQSNREVSEDWVKNNIYKVLYNFIVTLPLFDTALGKRALDMPDMFLLRGDTRDEIEMLKNLLEVVDGVLYPMDGTDWYETFVGYEVTEDKIYSLEKLIGCAEFLVRKQGKIDEEKRSVVKWCESICKLALKNDMLSRRVRAGEFAIFPCQKLEDGRVYYLRKLHEIRRDPGIPERLKDVTEILDELEPYFDEINTRSCCIRQNLLHKEFEINGLTEMMTYEWSSLANYIEAKTHESFRIKNYQYDPAISQRIRKQAWILMTSCGPDAEMYELVSQFAEEKIPKYENFDTPLNRSVWKNSYHGLLRKCVEEIKGSDRVENVRWYDSIYCPDIYKWLNLFYRKWVYFQYPNEDNGWRIYLNQEGVFKKYTEIMKDDVKSKELKKIAYGLRELSENCNYYKHLVHEDIVLESSFVMECRDKDVCMTINQVVTQLLTQCNLADATIEQQESCSLLLAWVQNNPDEANKYFPAYCSEEGMMKLLTPKAAVRMQQRVHKLEEMMHFLGCEKDEDALKMLQQFYKEKKAAEKSQIHFCEEEDVYLDGELFDELSQRGEEGFRKICKEIGIAGEQYVLEVIKQYYLGQELKVVSDSGTEIELHSVEKEMPRRVILCYPDGVNYNQSGWDISIQDSDKPGVTDYVEVKTHTKHSVVKNRVKLSESQMRLAIAEKENYHVVVATYDYPGRTGEGISLYEKFLHHIQSGRLKSTHEGYEFSL